MDTPLRLAAIAGSNRAGSLNRRLLDATTAALMKADDSVEVDMIDLRQFPLPLYDGDLQDRDGIPHAAHAIHDRVVAVDGVVFAMPEYNGGYPALFKNTVDWVSRIDMLTFHPRYVGLVAATPGKGGGARGLAHTAALFANIFVTTHDDHMTLPAAHEALAEGAERTELDERLREWATGYLDGLRAHVAARAAS